MPLERHALAAQIPDDGAQRAEPPGTEDNVVPGQGHDEEVGRERLAVDEQGRVADDAFAGDAFAVRDQGDEAWPVAERETRTPCRLCQ